MQGMIELRREKLVVDIDVARLASLHILTDSAAQTSLSQIWDTDQSDLLHYFSVLYDKSLDELSDKDSFITLSFAESGYIIDANEPIDVEEAKKQIEIDLEIINRESQWGKEDSIYFDQWWPVPKYDKQRQMLEFGVSLKDFHQKVFNRTVNRIVLTRYGYVSINYSLSERDILDDKPLSHYQKKLDEVSAAMTIKEGYRFQDVDEDNDFPSKSRMINLLLSSEIF